MLGEKSLRLSGCILIPRDGIAMLDERSRNAISRAAKNELQTDKSQAESEHSHCRRADD
jgi:hypothetical protein